MLVCNQCGCSEIDRDSGRGDAVCTQCGSVLEDQIIVSEVQFAENALGGASVMGQYVSTDGPFRSMTMGSGFHHGMGKESRQITLDNGKGRIQRLGAQLKLNQHCIDTAFNFFKMAVNRRLTRGRRSSHVIAACVYIVCRTEGTSHMLLDLSDVLQIDVYTLGRTYLQLSKELCISIPAFDPCLYIQRFAHKLEFGEKTHEVGMTALRLVQRMKRDWLAQGRRPSGLCGAALLVAGRIHDFNRKVVDVMRVVKIGEGTIRKRLAELEATPSSQLTIDEFQKIDLEEEMDPPCFTEGKRKAKLQLLEDQGQLGNITDEIAQLQKEIDKRLLQENEKRFKRYKKLMDSGTTESDATSSGLVSPIATPCGSPHNTNVDSFLLEETLKGVVSDTELTNISSSSQLMNRDTSRNDSITSSDQEAPGETGLNSGLLPRPSVASLGITSSIEDYMKVTIVDPNEQAEEEELLPEGCELDLSGIDDDELDALILSDSEVKIKTKIWMDANEEYLREVQAKKEREAKEQEEEANKPDHKKRKKTRKKATSKTTEHSTAADAIKRMLHEKKISCKINYDVLKGLNTTVGAVENEQPEPASLLGDGPIEVLPLTISPFNSQLKRPGNFVKTEPGAKRIKTESTVKQERSDVVKAEPIVESGPVQYHATDEVEEEEDHEEEEEEEHISAAALLGHHGEEDYYISDDGYD